MSNTIELIGHYGDDLTHALSAWTSTSRDITEEKRSRIGSLLEMLASEGHHTPFEKSTLHFLVTVDQATHIHLLKHRIGVSINGESARYKELKEDKSYIPSDWEGLVVESQLYDDGGWDGPRNKMIDWQERLESFAEEANKLYHECLAELSPVLGRKRAKESARFFKTMNSQITMDISFNWRSFAHFLHLRDSEHAQVEVRDLAQAMLYHVKNIEGNPFELTIKAFKL
jgi:flavin-dependent thymidylate synthase